MDVLRNDGAADTIGPTASNHYSKNFIMTPKLPPILLLLLLSSGALVAQTFVSDPAADTGFYFHGTLKNGSPTFPGSDTAAKLVRTGAPTTPSQVQLSPAALGLPVTVEILAVTHGDDEFGEWNIRQGGVNGRHHRIEYTVNPSATGSGYKKYKVYGYDYVMGCNDPAAPGVASVCPPPPQGGLSITGPFVVDAATAPSTSDDYEGLAHDQWALLPVYYTVRPSSVTAIRNMGGALAGFNSCDILTSYVDSNGQLAVAIALVGSALGLNANDSIDSLAAMWNGAGIIGLAPDSYSVVNGLQIGVAPHTTLALGNYLYSFVSSGSLPYCTSPPPGAYHFDTLNIWATAADLGLPPIGVGSNPVNSDCRGDVRVADPSEALQVTESLPLRQSAPWGNDYVSKRSLCMNNLDGSVFGAVQVALQSAATLRVNLAGSTTYRSISWALFRAPGALDAVPPSMWNATETVPFAPPPHASATQVGCPLHLSETYLGAPTGTSAIIGNVTLDPIKFPSGYALGQLSSTTQAAAIPFTAPAVRSDEMYVVVAYVTPPGSNIPVPKRTIVMTVKYRNRPAGAWPAP